MLSKSPATRLAVLLSSIAWAWPFQVGAFDATKFDDFKTTNVCKYCDLTDAPMSGRDMRGADFQNANLWGQDGQGQYGRATHGETHFGD